MENLALIIGLNQTNPNGAMIQMADKKQVEEISFGKRLATLRREAGYSQRQLAKKVGISKRMLVYYEVQTDRIPAHLLPQLSKALGISLEELMGLKKGKTKRVNRKVLEELEKVSELPRRKQQSVFDFINALVQQKKENK